MKVKTLIELLGQCDPEATVVVIEGATWNHFTEVNAVVRELQGSVGQRYSFEKIPVVRLTRGIVETMRENGLDVLTGPDAE